MADVGAMFDVLGARRRLLVAHDWGGVIAWAFAQDRMRPLDGLVIMNAPHPGVYANVLRRSPRQALRSWYVLFFQIPGLPEALLTANHARAVGDSFRRTAVDPAAFTDAAIAAYRDNAVLPGAMTAMINYYRANTRALQRWAGGGLEPIETPTLLVWGERDPFLDPRLVSAHAAVAARLSIHRLPQASHWVQQEAADEVNAAMAAWMRDQGLVSDA
jgi:pimeloyl-ACP methyl ester carboxylesterase